jgi:hypothetical protein
VNSTELPALKFPAFLPPDVALLREPVAREMAARIQHVPVQVITLRSASLLSSKDFGVGELD